MDIHEALNIVAKSLPLSSPAIVSEAWQTLKAAVSEQTAHNSQSRAMPCELWPKCPDYSITDSKNQGRDCGVCERIRKAHAGI